MRTNLVKEREGDRVLSWRRRQLLAAGFPRPLAGQIAAQSQFDLHALIELVESSCPPGLAVRILAPLDEADQAA